MQTQSIFDGYLEAKPLFNRNRRDILRPEYIPNTLPHRETEVQQLASIMVTALRGERPSNVLIFGKTGTGKTATVRYIEKEIVEVKKRGKLPDENILLSGGDIEHMEETSTVEHIYINCEIMDTAYGVLQNIGNRFIDVFDHRIPFTGWPLDRVYSELRKSIDTKRRIIIVVLDEIDKLVYKSGDDVLYHLIKINDDLEKARISIIGISNDLKFTEFLDPRVKSRLGEEKLIFPPYNATQLLDILKQRSDIAFREGVIDDDAIALCAAVGAKEHGDARRAIDLLRVAGEIAERSNSDRITEKHVYMAKNQIELDCIREVIRTLPEHSKMVLFGVCLNANKGKEALTTGEVYDTYQWICKEVGSSPLTQRRITDLISELDMLGIINARTISKGRYGRTREISISAPPYEIRNVLSESPPFEGLPDILPQGQTTISRF